MDHKDETEQRLLDMVNEAEARAKKAIDEVQFFRYMLDTYRREFSQLSASTVHVPSATETELVERMKDVSYRQMLHLWADAHDGRVVVKDLVTAAVSTGRFTTRTKAHRTLWSTVSQAGKKGEFERVAEGVYHARPTPLDDKARAEREVGAEEFGIQRGLPSPDESNPTLFIEPNMVPARSA